MGISFTLAKHTEFSLAFFSAGATGPISKFADSPLWNTFLHCVKDLPLASTVGFQGFRVSFSWPSCFPLPGTSVSKWFVNMHFTDNTQTMR